MGAFYINLVHHNDKKSGKENFQSLKAVEWISLYTSVEIICFNTSYTILVYSFVMGQHCPLGWHLRINGKSIEKLRFRSWICCLLIADLGKLLKFSEPMISCKIGVLLFALLHRIIIRIKWDNGFEDVVKLKTHHTNLWYY